MKLRTVCCLAALVIPLGARAQSSSSDGAAWFAIMLTPVGAIPAMELAPSADRHSVLAFHLSSWKFDGTGEERNNTLAASFYSAVGTKAMLGFTGAYFKPGGSGSDGTMMLGANVGVPMWESVPSKDNPVTFSVSGKGSLGYGHFLGDGGGNTYSFVAQIPLMMRYAMANKSSLSAFASPGFGFGGLSGGGSDSESGTRPVIAFGGAWTTTSGVGVHLSMQKVPLDGGPPWVTGLSMSIPMSRK